MTATSGIQQVRDIISWLRTTSAPDAAKLKAAIPSIEAALAEIERHHNRIVPEGVVLSAFPFCVRGTPGHYRVVDQTLADWMLSQCPQVEHIEVTR